MELLKGAGGGSGDWEMQICTWMKPIKKNKNYNEGVGEK